MLVSLLNVNEFTLEECMLPALHYKNIDNKPDLELITDTDLELNNT